MHSTSGTHGGSERVVIMHYHLKPGGVTSVIRDDVRALRRYSTRFERITVLTGSDEGAAAFRRALEADAESQELSRPAPELEVVVAPELDYREDCEQLSLHEPLRKLLQGFLSDAAVWWVHNYHLGKNPVFTEVLLELLDEHPGQRALLQIHDFAECGRYHNLARLQGCLTRDPYPTTPNLRYLTINARDCELLVAAGIPASQVWTLHNPVPPRPTSALSGPEASASEAAGAPRGRRAVRIALAEAFGIHDGQFDAELPMVLYPVRTIRRKNAFEALLLNRIAGRSHNILITLPGISEAEKRYSGLVKTAYREGLVTGLWGIGDRLDRANLQFDELVAAADLILSTSIQEGFGYQFIMPLTHSVPLLARRLEVLNGTDQLFDGFPAFFYEELWVPWTLRREPELQRKTRRAYERRLERTAALLPNTAYERLRRELDALLNAPTAEFSYLAPLHQYRIVKQAEADHGYRREVAALNTEIRTQLDHLLGGAHNYRPGRIRRIETWFGLRAVARGIETVVASLDAGTTAASPTSAALPAAGVTARPEPQSAAVAAVDRPDRRILPGDSPLERLTYAFARLENLRLLYD